MYWYGRYPDHDETEHLHSAWLMSQGQLPYTDFWQHHSPLFWILIAPIVGRLPHDGRICDFGRLFALGISLLTWGLALLFASRLHGRPSREYIAIMLVLMAGALGPGQFYQLRPDILADLTTTGALYMLLVLCTAHAEAAMPPRIQRRQQAAPGQYDVLYTIGSGVLLGLSVSLTPKHIYFPAVLPLLMIGFRTSLMRKAQLAAAHYLGVALGAAPLLIWLISHNLLSDFVYWVAKFNGGSRVVPGGTFPILFTLLALFWLYVRIRVDGSPINAKDRLVAISIALSALILILYKAEAKFPYHLQMFMILTSAAGAEALVYMLSIRSHWKRMAIVLIIAVPYVRSFSQVVSWVKHGDYVDGRAEVTMLCRIAGQTPVVCIPPRHPLMAFNATDLSQPWQYGKYIRYPEVAARARNIITEIETREPAIIFCGDKVWQAAATPGSLREIGTEFTRHLAKVRLLDMHGADHLQRYIEAHYTLVRLVRNYYWVRKDG